MKNLELFNGLEEMSAQEQKDVNGGFLFLAVLGGIAAGLAIAGALAYGAGYIYGRLTRES